MYMKVMEFFKRYPNAGAGERGRTQAIEKIRINIDWVTRHRDKIASWLYSNVDMDY